MSAWFPAVDGLHKAIFSHFGETMRIVAPGYDSGEFIGTFRVDYGPVGVGGDFNFRPMPRAMIYKERAGSASIIGGRLHVRGKAFPIVRVHDQMDGTLEIELGFGA
jgi:hypothetical protein